MNVDLTNCDREPIHIIGRIQSFGVLLALSPDWIIAFASQNISNCCESDASSLIGCPVRDVITDAAIHALRTRLQLLSTPESVERVFALDLFGNGQLMDVAVHFSSKYIVLEAESASTDAAHHYVNYVRPMTDRIKQGGSTQQMCEIAARQLRALTGFDRVMVYRFSDDGSGEVIAESRAQNIDGFMGLHFPASDIPAQARRLYTQNLLRIISDIDAPTYEIVPTTDAYGDPLDLTMSTLRAISPIHVEYLRNMGVRASMSVSIMRDGNLWGLFACHHYKPLSLSYPVRTATELFGELFAYMLDQSENSRSRDMNQLAAQLHTTLMSRLAEGGDLANDFEVFGNEIRKVIPHDGIVGWINGEFMSRGDVPAQSDFMGLVRLLNTTGTGSIWCTDHIAAFYPAGELFAEKCAGLLALPVSRSPRDYIVLFRSEITRSVRWAGNPEKSVTLGPNGDRLTPRKSFEEWKQVVKGHSTPWTDDQKQCAEHLRVTLLEVVLRLTESASREREEAGKRQEILIAELNHRVRNILNLIRSLINQSQPGDPVVSDYADLLGSRIEALARAHDQLTKNDWAPTRLRDLIAVESRSWLNDSDDRLVITGVGAIIQPRALTTMALVFHELITNSCKYGALSVPSGKVSLTFEREEDDALSIQWVESGGPTVKPPSRRGFGSTIIERSIPYELKGEAEIEYDPDGVVATLKLPADSVARFVEHDDHVPATAPVTEEKQPPATFTPPASALVVEDNVLISIETEELLLSCGVKTVHLAASVKEALAILDRAEVDFALLDVNLGTETSAPVAVRLNEMNIPFIVASGYGDSKAEDDAYAGAEVLTKPYNNISLRSALAAIPKPD
ncbi:MAG: GAF domain-containing protein [Sphingobium sp.]|nr:GAF domain-containing protein [Sphingobium sp.]MCP5400663.1 GAF domain-containing protein [Sphingomonas sp.]